METRFFNYFDAGKLQESVGIPKGENAREFIFPVERSGMLDSGMAMRRIPGQVESPIRSHCMMRTDSKYVDHRIGLQLIPVRRRNPDPSDFDFVRN
jgi:hypothetical protein